MIGTNCDWIRDRLPEYAQGGLDTAESAGVDTHLSACEACRSELALVRLLRESRVEVPAGLDARVVAAAATGHRAWAWSPRRLGMAATVAFAMITAGVVWQTNGGADGRAASDLAGPAGVDWSTGEPTILRGGLDLGALSEDELLKLLEELDS